MYLISCIVFSSFHIQRILKIQKVLQEDETLKRTTVLHYTYSSSVLAVRVPYFSESK